MKLCGIILQAVTLVREREGDCLGSVEEGQTPIFVGPGEQWQKLWLPEVKMANVQRVAGDVPRSITGIVAWDVAWDALL